MAKQSLKIKKGSTLQEIFRWETSKKIYKVITGISNAAPVVITSTAHGLPASWRGKITNVVGMTDINDADTYREITKIDANTLEINSINSVGYKAYVSGGILEYPEPVNLSGFTARMQVRSDVDSETVLLELTTENGGILIDSANSTIKLYLSAFSTAAITWEKGIYSLELTSSSGVVTELLEGNITMLKEISR